MSGQLLKFAGRKDFIFMIFLLCISCLFWGIHYADHEKTGISAYNIKVLTEPQQEIVYRVPPREPVRVRGVRGETLIEWNSKGEVRIASSDCPCKICVNTGWNRTGSIVCIPNGVVVNIVPENKTFDAVTR